MLPVHLTLQWHPLGRSEATLRPYVGVGVAATLTWEKSGALDSTDAPLSFGPAVQVGTVVSLSSRVVLSLDAKWNTLRVEIDGLTTPAPRVDVDPLTLGIGIGVGL